MNSNNLRKMQEGKAATYQAEADDELKYRLNSLLYNVEKELKR